MTIARNKGAWACLAFGVVGVFVTAQFHLLAGIRLMLVAMLALALLEYRYYLRERRLDAVALTGLVALPLSLVFNPAFGAMRQIAEHDGVLNFAVPVSAGTLLLMATVVLGVAAAAIERQLFRQRERQVVLAPVMKDEPESQEVERGGKSMEAAQFLYIIAAGVALAAIAQVLLFMLFDIGSAYAVKKHTFGVLTFGLAASAVLIGVPLDDRLPREMRQRFRTLSATLILGAYGLLMAALFVRPNVVDVARVIDLSRNVTSAKAKIARTQRVGTPLFISSSLPMVVNYYVTVALLNSPRDANAYGLLQGYRIADLDKVSYIVTEAGDNTFDRLACHSNRESGALAVIARECFERAPPVGRSLGPAKSGLMARRRIALRTLLKRP